jgi:hypothetical protein
LVIEIIGASRYVKIVNTGMRTRVNENSIDVFIFLFISVTWNRIPSTFGSKNSNSLTNTSCPRIKSAIETITI